MHFPDNVTRLCGRKKFSFGCHPKVACFTECCRDLELALTPYDVLRLCRELHLSSAEFLDCYAVVEEDENGGFPRLYLGMVDDGRASCPFISAAGCRVYRNRPGACRAYPVGRGVSLDENGRLREVHVLIREPHCLGFAEPVSQSVSEWFENQGLHDYNTINDAMLSLLQHEQIRCGARLTPVQTENFMLALYKLDEFRKVVSTKDFQDGYQVSPEKLNKIMADDQSLLLFAISWLKKYLFAEPR